MTDPLIALFAETLDVECELLSEASAKDETPGWDSLATMHQKWAENRTVRNHQGGLEPPAAWLAIRSPQSRIISRSATIGQRSCRRESCQAS